MPTLSQDEAVTYLHTLVNSASDEDIIEGWSSNIRAAVYRHWFHATIESLPKGRIEQSVLDCWQTGLKSTSRMRLTTPTATSTTTNTSPASTNSTSSDNNSSSNRKARRREGGASNNKTSHKDTTTRHSYNPPAKPAPVVIPVGGEESSRTTTNTKKRRPDSVIVPPRSPDRTKQLNELNVKIGELKLFIDEQFRSLKQTNHFRNITPRPILHTPREGGAGDSPPESSASPSPSPQRKRKMRRRSGSSSSGSNGRLTPVALDMIQETADAAEKEEDIVATVLESPHTHSWDARATPPTVGARTYLLVSPKGAAAGATMFGGRLATGGAKSPIYDSRWEPQMSDTRVSVGLIPLPEACVATPSPDIFVDEDDPDELDSILAKYL